MSNSHKLSIIIPTFNRGNLLPVAIESALAQTVSCEVLVVDHGSTDNTPDVVSMYGDRIKYIRHEVDSGPCVAWLDGVIQSSGEYIHLQYDDDWIAPEFAEKTLSQFGPDVGLVFSKARVVAPDRQFDILHEPIFSAGLSASTDLVRHLMTAPLTISPGCAVFRRIDAIEALMMNPVFTGGFYRGAGPDLMLFLSTLSRYPAYAFVPEVLAFFRSHDGSITTDALKDASKSQRLVLAYDEYKFFYMINLGSFRICASWLHRAVELLFEQFNRLKIFG